MFIAIDSSVSRIQRKMGAFKMIASLQQCHFHTLMIGGKVDGVDKGILIESSHMKYLAFPFRAGMTLRNTEHHVVMPKKTCFQTKGIRCWGNLIEELLEGLISEFDKSMEWLTSRHCEFTQLL